MGGSDAVGEDVGEVLAAGKTVGTSAKLGDGVASKASVAVGTSALVGDGCGVGVHRTPRERATSINTIVESLFMIVGNCRKTLS